MGEAGDSERLRNLRGIAAQHSPSARAPATDHVLVCANVGGLVPRPFLGQNRCLRSRHCCRGCRRLLCNLTGNRGAEARPCSLYGGACAPSDNVGTEKWHRNLFFQDHYPALFSHGSTCSCSLCDREKHPAQIVMVAYML